MKATKEEKAYALQLRVEYLQRGRACQHNMQNHSTRYGPIYWCTHCKRTYDEIESEAQELKRLLL